MNITKKLLMTLLVVFGLVGCSQEDKAEPKAEKEGTSTSANAEVDEGQGSNDNTIISQLIGHWEDGENYISITKNGENLNLEFEDNGQLWNMEMEVQSTKEDTVEGLVVDATGGENLGMKFGFIIKDEAQIDIDAGGEVLSLSRTTENRESWNEEKALAEKQLEYVYVSEDGEEVDFTEFRGKKVVLIEWNSFIEPSAEMLNTLNDIYDELNQNDIIVYSFSNEGTSAEDYIKENDIKIPNLSDRNSELSQYLGYGAVPTIFVYDVDGYRTDTISGPVEKDELKERISSE